MLLRVVGLSKRYRQGHWFSRTAREVQALRAVDLNVQAGSTLGVVGASGSGKSTLARCLAGIEPPDTGEIWFAGKNLARDDRELLPLKRQIQMIFQDPAASLNPRLPAIEIVSEPLLIARERRKQRRERAAQLIELVGLPADSHKRLPFEFSGGQRRRLAIARALAVEPRILILDESLAGLDLSVQAQIANLLQELQQARALTYICISHQLNLVASLCDEIAVMDQGEIVDLAPTAELLKRPRHIDAGLRESARFHSFRAGSQ
jgi:ABC-type glutathione transport system ATPase component